ncbi:MAG: hypothetical protein ABF990_11910 [Acetobacter sp.]|uniref:hypothetical protein n=1 Tax=Acetobacter sp. TaxID=440 RepID=UPI0039EBDF14
MADLSIKIDSKAVQKQLSDMSRQIPFALATAVNDLAFKVMRSENQGMVDLFANPRPFTQRATQVEKRASKSDLFAVVSLRPAQERYLLPYEDGGEHATSGNGGRLLVPVDGPVDQYGQIPKGMLARLLARPDVFAGTVKGIAGIWQRPARGTRRDGRRGSKGALQKAHEKKTPLKLLYVWKANTDVTKRLGFVEKARRVVAADGPASIAAAIQKAIRTAR